MQLFSITAQVAGFTHEATATNSGTGIVVTTDTGIRVARTISDATRIAAQDIGLFLRKAEQPGIPWGLQVAAGSASAVYGEFPLLSVPVQESRRREITPVARIRRMWQDGDGPLAALENALRIIDAYTGRRAAA